MRHRPVAALAAALVAVAPAAAAPDAARLSAAFGAREAVRGMTMSPSGTHVAYLTPVAGDRSALMVVDLAQGKQTPALHDLKSDAKLEWCEWKTDIRLICVLSAIDRVQSALVGFTRTVAIDRDGRNLRIIGQRPNFRTIGLNQSSGSIVDWLADDPSVIMMSVGLEREMTTGTRMANDKVGMSVQAVPVAGGSMRMVEPPIATGVGFASDGRGAIRLVGTVSRATGGRMVDTIRYSVRAKGDNTWRTLGQASIVDGGFRPIGFDEAGDNVLALIPHNGRQALFRVAADGSNRRELLFAHPNVDVDGVLRIGKYRRPVAARYTLDGEELEFFDPALKRLAAGLSKALPDHPLVSVLDESWDGSRKLVFAGSDTDPGRYFWYDGKTRQLEAILPVRPPLADVALGPMKAVTYAARDGTRIPGFLTLPHGREAKGLPAIVLPHGGPGARDVWGFDWLPQYFASLGYAVLQPNFRGSTGYGEEWFQKNGIQSWDVAIGDVNDGARWLAAEGIADPKKLAIVGWSYGGYAALQANVVDPDLYRAAVAVAPVTDFAGMIAEARNYTSYNLVRKYIGSGPHITAGSPARNAGRIKAPVLMFHGDRDLNVDISQARVMDSALRRAGKPATLIEYKGLDHQIEDGAARTDMLKRSADFLAEHVQGGS